MITIEKQCVCGIMEAIRGMRNPMNSWDKSDSTNIESDLIVGDNDYALMRKLAANGPVHAKYRRMIIVYADITAPLYWWKEFDTYKVGTVANSCSTMHRIHAKEFTLDDFSHEHLLSSEDRPWSEIRENLDEDDALSVLHVDGDKCYFSPKAFIGMTCNILNTYRNRYLETRDKKYWWQMIQLLPSSYNQKRTVMMSYEALANMHKHRKEHKLDEWRGLCGWIETLPVSSLITLEGEA